MFKTGLSVHNNHLNLCGKVENSKWILCCQKTGFEGDVMYLHYE